ncbi:MAG: hypothetical protein Q8N26_37580 [Myxococcales bacterium]|nr:hypothetical protein [Myxococcales bacterium]
MSSASWTVSERFSLVVQSDLRGQRAQSFGLKKVWRPGVMGADFPAGHVTCFAARSMTKSSLVKSPWLETDHPRELMVTPARWRRTTAGSVPVQTAIADGMANASVLAGSGVSCGCSNGNDLMRVSLEYPVAMTATFQ